MDNEKICFFPPRLESRSTLRMIAEENGDTIPMKSTCIYTLKTRAPRQYTSIHKAELLPEQPFHIASAPLPLSDETLDVVRGGLNIDIPNLLPNIALPDLSGTPLNPLAQLLVSTLS